MATPGGADTTDSSRRHPMVAEHRGEPAHLDGTRVPSHRVYVHFPSTDRRTPPRWKPATAGHLSHTQGTESQLGLGMTDPERADALPARLD